MPARLLDDLTRALRAESAAPLTDALRQLLDRQQTPLVDQRDLLSALAPIHDCATRLGLSPVALFDAASQERPAELRDIVQRFARRDDITPEAFGFTVRSEPAGPTYEWVPASHD